MKKLLILLLSLVAFSCSLDDDAPNSYQELLPVNSAILPEEFVLGETYEISVSYVEPTTCHAFNNIYTTKNGNELNVAIVSTYFQNNGTCQEAFTEEEATFSFTAHNSGSYIFNFWQGQDEVGGDYYMTMEVPVVE